MHPDDIFIQKHWGSVPTELHSRHVEFIYDPLEEFLYVNIPYTSKSKEFKLGSTTMKDIETWFNGYKRKRLYVFFFIDFFFHLVVH